jgi:hypothetical protein
MDPNATLRYIDHFIACGDTGVEVDYACQDLYDWLAKGGFKPDWDKYELGTSYYECRAVQHKRGVRVEDEEAAERGME